ncbi:MAG: hypothetical protein M3388_17905 [Acidobacteriota bacterium]|nr:hypothetical protein [Acidobacteriota bacterium]
MEAIVNAKKFKEQIGALQGIFARKETIPVLGIIKIGAGTRGDLVMTATDLDFSLIIEQEVDILQPGSILLSGKNFTTSPRLCRAASRFISNSIKAASGSSSAPVFLRVNCPTPKADNSRRFRALRAILSNFQQLSFTRACAAPLSPSLTTRSVLRLTEFCF